MSRPEDPHAVLSRDPDLGPVVRSHGPLELEPATDVYRRLVVSIVRQQISMDAAEAILGRLEDANEITPEAMASVDPVDLRAVGLSQQKATCVRATAEAFRTNGYDRSYFDEMDTATVIDTITAVEGIGPWTAKMFCMFALGREDIFPVEDLGVRRGLLEVVDRPLERSEMVPYAERWRPYRSYAALYCWAAYEA